MKQKTTVDVLTVFVAFLVFMQTSLLAAPFTNPHTLTLVSVIFLYVIQGLSYWKQLLSDEIANKSIKWIHLMLVISLIGGLNDIFNVIQLSDTVDQWVRWGITMIVGFLNLSSKLFFPTENTTSKI
jgi:hypothetical protein